MADNLESFYQHQLMQIASELDDKHLGTKILPHPLNNYTDPEKYQTTANTSTFIQSISSQWQNINKQQVESKIERDHDNLKCISMDDCSKCNRIVFVLQLFDRLVLKYLINPKSDQQPKEFTDIFMYTLSEKHNYFVHDLLNDFQHLNMYHLNKDGKKLQTCTIDNNVEYCVHDLIIEYRDNGLKATGKYEQHDKYKSFMKYLQKLDHEQMTMLNIVSKIHFTIKHQDEIMSDDDNETQMHTSNIKLPPARLSVLDANNGDESVYNKFVNEIAIEDQPAANVGNNCPRDVVWDNLVKSGVKPQQATDLMQYLINNHYDTDAAADDIIDCDGNDLYLTYGQSNIIQQLPQDRNMDYLMRVIKNTLNLHGNDNDKIPPFQFGLGIFYHTQYFQGKKRYINRPKYVSLKEELLNNTIYAITGIVWDGLLQKATIYHNSNYIRNIKARQGGKDNGYYEIPVGLPLTKSHLLVLMSYTNNTKMQYHFKKYGCRRLNNKQSLDQLIELHLEIANWYRLLFETMKFYSIKCQLGDTFYTGMSIRLSFTTFVPYFGCPMSTSTSFSVAHRFSKGKGIVLTLKALSSSNDRYFDVQYISDYPHEEECLFFQARRLEVTNINYFNGKLVYGSEHWLIVFKLLSGIFSAHYVFISSKLKQIKKAQDLLLSLIIVYERYNNVEFNGDDHKNITIDIYVQQLFYTLLHNLKKIKTIKSQYDILSQNIKQQLMEITENDGDYNINLGPILYSLSIKPKNVTIWEEYQWILSDEQLRKLKEAKADEFIECNEKWNYESSLMSVKFVISICRNLGGSERTGLQFNIHNTSQTSINANFSVLVDELQYTKNNSKFNIKREKEKTRRSFFDDALVNELSSLSIYLSIQFE